MERDDEYMTAKKIADLLGVSKSTAVRYISQIEDIDRLTKWQGNKALYKNEVANIVQKLMSEKVKNQVTEDESNKANIASNTQNNDLIESNHGDIDTNIAENESKNASDASNYEAIIAALTAQLEANREIVSRLQNELDIERQHSRETSDKLLLLADQAQKLQLAQMQPQLEAPKKRKSLLQRLIKRDD